MKPRVSTWLAVAGAGAALLAGCGGSSTSGQTASGGGGAPSSPGTSVSGIQSVASCKHTIQTQKALSVSAKARLEKICEKAAGGNPATAQRVAAEACIELVKVMHVPTGIAKAEALALCDSVKPK